MALSLKRTLTLLLLVCVVSGAFFVGRMLGANNPSTPLLHHLISAGKRAAAPLGIVPNPLRSQDAVPDVPPGEVFEEALSNVQRNFVEINDLPPGKLDNNAIAQMYASLGDPKTHALAPDRRKARQDALQGQFEGIGATLAVTRSKKADVDYSHLTVVDVMPGSPAEKAGLRSGDNITEIDNHWIINYTIYADADRIAHEKNVDNAARDNEMQQVQQKFKAGLALSRVLDRLEMGEGKTYALTIERTGQPTPLKLSVTTARTQVDPVEYKAVGTKIGYLRIRQFNSKATDEFDAALNKVEGLKGLIVDLRQNPGGVTAETRTGVDGYTSVKQLIARLTPGGAVAALERKPKQRETLTVTPSKIALKVPIVVLVDSGTANLAELTASALRDAGKARLVGSHTFGDDTLQLFALLKNGAGVELTTAHLFTAHGIDLARGLEPDVPIIAATAGGQDEALARALLMM